MTSREVFDLLADIQAQIVTSNWADLEGMVDEINAAMDSLFADWVTEP